MRTSPPPPYWASLGNWSPSKSSLRSPAQSPCSRKNTCRPARRGSRNLSRMMMAQLTVPGAAARAPELADDGGLVTSGRNGVICVGI